MKALAESRDLIEYTGISDSIYADSSAFKQLVIDKRFCMLVEKPDIEQITKIEVKSEITETALISTPIGVSLDGTIMTGASLAVSGEILIKMQYIGASREQPLFGAYFSLPFTTAVVLRENFDRYAYLNVKAYVEDVEVALIDSRCIYVRAALYLTVLDVC